MFKWITRKKRICNLMNSLDLIMGPNKGDDVAIYLIDAVRADKDMLRDDDFCDFILDVSKDQVVILNEVLSEKNS